MNSVKLLEADSELRIILGLCHGCAHSPKESRYRHYWFDGKEGMDEQTAEKYREETRLGYHLITT